MEKDFYLQDPCGASSLPFWKTNSITIPDDMLILREDDPRLQLACQIYVDTKYFKLIHRLRDTHPPCLPDGFRFIRPSEKDLSRHIASCYDAERASEDELFAYGQHPTYSPDLWLAILNETTGEIIASGIAEQDATIREGVLEWIQVSPAYRRRGWGRIIVYELLWRLTDQADFVTVSGKVNERTAPRALYERCVFGEAVIWHVLKKR